MGTGGFDDAQEYVEQGKEEALGFLDDALRNSIAYSEYFTEQALEVQREQFAQARSDIEKYYEIGQAQTAPYRQAGYNALDTYMDTLGMARPTAGAGAMAGAAEARARKMAGRREMAAATQKLLRGSNVPPAEARKIMQSAVYGGNTEGLMEALGSYGMTESSLFSPPEPLSSTSKNRMENYGDLLGATSGRFNGPSPLAQYAADIQAPSQELGRARMNTSSGDAVLAQLAQTGYGGLG